MPTAPDIRWRKKDVEKLQKAVKRFNDRADYYRKTKGIAPERIRASELYKDDSIIKTRNDFNRFLRELENFNRKTSHVETTKTGIQITAWEKQRYENAIKIRNQRAQREKKRRQDLEVVYDYKRRKRSELQMNEEAVLNDMKSRLDRAESYTELQKHVQAALKQSSEKYYDKGLTIHHENYLTAIDNAFGDRGKELKELVNQLSPEELYNIVLTHNDTSIQFVYDKHQELEKRIRHLTNVFKGK